MSVVAEADLPERVMSKHLALAIMLTPRDLPDYTWPAAVPTDWLRRTIEREMREAADMAAQVLPHWKAKDAA